MIANIAMILIGLWLVYRAIFSIPIGDMSQVELMGASTAVILLALWARRTDFNEMAQLDKYHACRALFTAGCSAPGGWGGPTGIVLDGSAHRHRHGHNGDVVDTLSAQCS
jgi:hypothetical protein